jgi:hypothetical protein
VAAGGKKKKVSKERVLPREWTSDELDEVCRNLRCSSLSFLPAFSFVLLFLSLSIQGFESQCTRFRSVNVFSPFLGTGRANV